jgi:hypothetical protein
MMNLLDDAVRFSGNNLIIFTTTPRSQAAGRVVVTVTDADPKDGKLAHAEFEFFTPATVVQVSPKKATLQGQTTATDGNSIRITLQDFPILTSAR